MDFRTTWLWESFLSTMSKIVSFNDLLWIIDTKMAREGLSRLEGDVQDKKQSFITNMKVTREIFK